jgi:NAD(P)-dependent dehydrogenase (short-subunit alcohol dehydrogenase family)
VTGGGRGIGRAIALSLADAGARVAVIARSAGELGETVRLIEQKSGTAKAFPADVTEAAALAPIFVEIERSLGPVDVLVNNAGILGPLGPFVQADAEQWWCALEVNLRGPVVCAHAVLPGMAARRRGRIVNVARGAGDMAISYFSAYVASKTALIRFTECLAAEMRPYGVAVFALGPGIVCTAMSDYSLNSPEGRKWLPWFRRIIDEGFASPQERPAAMVLSLVSGLADALSGRFLQTTDNLELLLASAAEIEREKLYSLRIRRLGAEQPNPALAAIRAEAERTRE